MKGWEEEEEWLTKNWEEKRRRGGSQADLAEEEDGMNPDREVAASLMRINDGCFIYFFHRNRKLTEVCPLYL